MTSEISNSRLLSKFKGCMIGGLVGDCLGEPFEEDMHYLRATKEILGKYFSNWCSGGSEDTLPYTDDTCMTISIANSLVENKKVDPDDLAKKFVADFYIQPPQRGWGCHVMGVFKALKRTNFEDVYLPGKMVFNGTGSYGNGAAMRIAPIALFNHDKTDESLQSDVEKCSRITHNHPYGYNGAILQCLAVKAALKSDSTKEFDPIDFINELQKKMETIEMKDDSPYCESLKKIKKILQDQKDISAKEIAELLGNDISAHRSVPTALYSFLRGMKPLSDYECENPFVRTIYFAISVGGDTDTIATMAGSIAGAYYGIEAIPVVLQNQCESKDEIDKLAKKLYDVSQEVTSCDCN